MVRPHSAAGWPIPGNLEPATAMRMRRPELSANMIRTSQISARPARPIPIRYITSRMT